MSERGGAGAIFGPKLLWSGRLDGTSSSVVGDVQLAAASVALPMLGLRRPRSPVYVGWGVWLLTAMATDLLLMGDLFRRSLRASSLSPARCSHA